MNNDVTIEIYEGLTRVFDISNDLDFAENIQFNTHIPGGDYGDASFFVERDVTAPILFEIGHRVVMYNEHTAVYEGFICGINRIVEDDFQGIEFLCVGATDWYLMEYPLEKRWVDTRITDDVLVLQTSGTETEDWTIERQGRIHITPNPGQFTSGEYVALRYTQPVGQTTKRITYTYDFSEKSGQTWEMSVWRSTDGVNFTQMQTNAISGDVYALGTTTVVTAAGSDNIDVTLATPSRYIELRFYSRATNNPVNDDHNHGIWSNLHIYSETDSPITMTTIAQDCAAEVGAAGYISTSTTFIQTAGTQLTLDPFITNGYPSVADILNDAVSRGDGAYNRWIWGVRESSYVSSTAITQQSQFLLLALTYTTDILSTTGGKPVLYLEQYPATTDWEYEITFGEENIAAGIELLQDGLAIANHIITSRTDENGKLIYQTPADDANLADATSKTDNLVLAGVRLDAGDCDQTEATAYARRFLATYKDPPFKLLRPLVLMDYIRRKDGSEHPVRLIRSGERIKLTNFVTSLSGVEPVFVITAVSHSVADDLVSITTGVPGAPIGARQVLRPVSAPPGDATGGSSTPAAGVSTGGGGGDRMKFNWWERYWKVTGKKKGLSIQEAKAEWNTMQQGKRNAWKKDEWKAWKKKKGG